NGHTTIEIPPGATEADIATALSDVQSAGGGEVKLMGRAYTASGAVAFDIYLPTVTFDMGGATISYTGSGVCLRVRMNPFTVAPAGLVRNGTIDGGGASAGAVGI